MNSNKQVVVIGAGIVGAAMAFFLSKLGAKVTVVDAAEPGQGATTVSFGWLNARNKEPRAYQDLNRRSLDMWSRFARLLGEDVGLRWGGELRWVATESAAETLTEQVHRLHRWGYPIELLDGAAFKALEPTVATGRVAAASYSTLDGHVDTGRVVAACLKRAAARGATIHTSTAVTGLRLAAGSSKIEAVQLDGHAEIKADAVVLATGPDAPVIGQMAGLAVPVEYTFGATLITEPLPPLFKNVALIHSPTDLETPVAMRQFADGAVMIHGGDGGTVGRSLGQTEAEVERVWRTAVSFVPALEGATITAVRRGRRPIPADKQSIVGFSQAVPNCYLAVTHSGVTLAPLIGETAAMEIVNETDVDLLAPYRLERF